MTCGSRPAQRRIEMNYKKKIRPFLYASTTVLFGIFLLAVIMIPFYKEGSITLAGSHLIEEHEYLSYGKSLTLMRIPGQLVYDVAIRDIDGAIVEYATMNSPDELILNSNVRYFAPYPKIYIPTIYSHVVVHLIVGAIFLLLAVCLFQCIDR